MSLHAQPLITHNGHVAFGRRETAPSNWVSSPLCPGTLYALSLGKSSAAGRHEVGVGGQMDPSSGFPSPQPALSPSSGGAREHTYDQETTDDTTAVGTLLHIDADGQHTA
ncbi:uncharacterized protein K460DRAFT_405897 [Cucurbitaria berberidis CBS 394.84]|uniref:Uncharacterized protein n=1 Tax=Cucurbitaria berberidis CBS 394.84 TaxID=1168544 RepID=A0A9P4GGH3_9PLEO|nr:uncharacterized protein K460DRAFT_405897 [Cucurbitaria berberidis CBS 394.84]KAF1845653.1 hypothetical protein K460DRAFT_405897 [Cucurbitaria berberidis CBS 394.84]